jgi:tetratricopeptide (TPR) repeat protein
MQMKFFDGLFPYEVVLLVLGVLLFLVLLLVFVVLVIRGKPYGKILMSFAIPIVMVGFPGIKSFEISESVVKIEKNTQALQQNPTDKNVRESLAKEVASVSARSLADPKASVTIARAQIALGDNTAAEANLKKALNAAPQLPAALELKKRIELDRNLVEFTSQVEQNPSNAAAKAKLENTVREAAPLKIANPETITNVARAQKVLGEQAKAQANVDRALTINPNLNSAIKLKRQFSIPGPTPGSGNR